MQSLKSLKLGPIVGILAIAVAFMVLPVQAGSKAWLGVSLQDLNRDLREALDLKPSTDGIVVNSVFDDSPAEKAGLKRHDVIVEANGHDVEEYDDLTDVMDDLDPGDTLKLSILRDGDSKNIKVTLGDRSDASGFTFFDGDGGLFGGDDNTFVLDLDELRDGKWKDLMGKGFKVDVDEDGNRMEITITEDEDGDDSRKVIILGDGDDDRERHRFRNRHRIVIDDDDLDDEDGNVIILRDRDDDDDHHGGSWVWHHRDNRDGGGFLGVSTTSMGEQLAAYFGVDEDEGVLIESVVEDSPAEKAGLKAGDVILAVGDDDIEDSGDLLHAIREHDPGDEVEIKILRNKKTKTIKVTLAEADDFGSIAPMMELEDLGERLRHAIPKHIEIAPRAHFDNHWNSEVAEEVRREIQHAQREARKAMRGAQKEVRKAMEEARRELRDHFRHEGRHESHDLEELHEHLKELHEHGLKTHEKALREYEKALKRARLRDA